MKIGIVGQGYVGKALKLGIENNYQVEVFDKDSSLSSVKSLHILASNCKIIFICVPTPMNNNGSCNTSIVEEVIRDISSYSLDDRIVVIKSTIIPGTTKRLSENHPNLKIIFNPEFLTEANFIEDFKNQDRIVLGGDTSTINIIEDVYSKVFPKAKIIQTGSVEAEMVKYFCNAFLATKVSFANEMKSICDSLNIDFNKVVECAVYDKRIENSHLNVPGPDGKIGFGGSCLPKDVNALISLFDSLGIDADTIRGAWETNLKVRPEKDWLKLRGRAVNREQ